MLIVQRIATEWTKASRGGKQAALRNAVPESLNLPSIAAGAELIHHEAGFHESASFVARERIVAGTFETHHEVGAAWIDPKPNQVDVRFVWDWWKVGAPERKSRLAFTLNIGDSGRLIYNGRFSDVDEGNWWYRKEVINIALVDAPNRRIFRRTTPTFIVSEMAQLR